MATTVRSMRVRALDHLVLNVADVERSIAWYCDLLGLAPERVDAWRRGEVPFPSVRIDAGSIIDLIAAPRSGNNVDHVVSSSTAQTSTRSSTTRVQGRRRSGRPLRRTLATVGRSTSPTPTATSSSCAATDRGVTRRCSIDTVGLRSCRRSVHRRAPLWPAPTSSASPEM